MPPLDILLTATGLATSVGLLTANACAAIRAGISRPQQNTELFLFDPELLDITPMVTHPVAGLTEGFFRIGRWLCLARLCIDSFLGEAGPEAMLPSFWQRTDLLVISRALDTDFLQIGDEANVTAEAQQRFLTPLRAMLPAPVRQAALVMQGAAGTAVAAAIARKRIDNGEIDRALLLGVDSWIEPGLLGRAEAQGRVKTEERSTGFIPGEAAAAVLLEHAPSAAWRRASPLARLSAIAMNRESVDPIRHPELAGPALCAAVAAALQELGVASFRGEVFVDLSGEEWRARQWGMALVHLGERLTHARTHFPAGAVGHTGAVSGILSTCLAMHSLRRSWACTPSVLAVMASDTGETGCLALERVAP